MHDNDVVLLRLQKELDEWKQKASKLRSEVDGLQAKYLQIEKAHNAMKRDQAACDAERYTFDNIILGSISNTINLLTCRIHVKHFENLLLYL